MDLKFDTTLVHSTTYEKNIDSKITPIYQTSSFTFSDLDDLESFYEGNKNYLYTRTGNPNTDDIAYAVAKLEQAPKGVATSSGTSAIMAGILAVVKHGEHVIATKDLYGGTYQLLAHELKDLGIEVSFVDFVDSDNIKREVRPNTRLIYSESITNPLLRVENMKSLVAIAKEYQLSTMIDNTFATPYLLNPYLLGVDLVVHSATKYIGGHSDVTAGVLVGSESLINKANAKVVNLGANLSPFEAWLCYRGVKTLSVRMERHIKNAEHLAAALSEHPGVEKVYYPKEASTKGNGAIVTIDISNTCDIEKFFKSLSWIKIVPTLAGLETSVSYPLVTSHRALPSVLRDELGITKGLIRISVGIEDSEDIIKAMTSAIEQSQL